MSALPKNRTDAPPAGAGVSVASIRHRLGALHAVNFTLFGIHLPFFPVWLAGKGLTPEEIGLALGIPAVVRTVMVAPLSSLADRRMGATVLLAAAHLAVVAGLAVLAGSEGFWPILILSCLVAAPMSALIPVSDALTLAHARVTSFDYGRVRLWGSVAFLATTMAAGWMMARLGPLSVVPAMAAVCAVAVVVSWRAPAAPAAPPSPAADTADATAPGSDRRLLWLVMTASAAIQASHAALYGFGSLRWGALGYSETVIGLFWALGVLAEIVVFARAGRRLGTAHVAALALAAGGGIAALRFGTLALGLQLGTVGEAAMQVLHAGSFGLTHLGAMALLARFAPAGRRNRAQGWLAAAHSLAMALGMVAAGQLYGWDVRAAFGGMVPLALFGVAAGLLLAGRVDRRGDGGYEREEPRSSSPDP